MALAEFHGNQQISESLSRHPKEMFRIPSDLSEPSMFWGKLPHDARAATYFPTF